METKERARANSLGLSRRALLKAAPALTLAGAAPALAAQAETPIMALLREWLAHNAWLNSPATDNMTEAEFDDLCTDDTDLIRRIIAEPARDVRDLCAKLLAATDFGTSLSYAGLEGLDRLPDEAREMMGG